MTTILPSEILRFQSDKSDKIWGSIKEDSLNNYYTFWGKVNGVIAFKAWPKDYGTGYEINNLARQKHRKGYKVTSYDKLPPETKEKYDQAVVMATLGLLRVK